MSGFVAYTFTDAQLVDIRRFCGFPTRSNGIVLFPAPWVNVQYLALEVRLQTLSANEAAVVMTTYLANLYTLETAIVNASATLNVGTAGPFVRNTAEMRERNKLFDDWRRRLCGYLGIEPGPGLGQAGLRLVV